MGKISDSENKTKDNASSGTEEDKREESQRSPSLQMHISNHSYSQEAEEILMRWLQHKKEIPFPNYLQRRELCK